MAASNKDDFFGVSMTGANPYAMRYQPVHDMRMQDMQVKTNLYANQAQATQGQPQPNMPQGWDNMFRGGQLNRISLPSSSAQVAPPTNNGSPNLDPPGYIGGYYGPDGKWVQGSPGSLKQVQNDDGSGVTFPDGSSQGPPTTLPGSQHQSGNIPADLVQLRQALQRQYMDMIKPGDPRFDPSFTREQLTVGLDPSWGRLNDTMYNQLGLSNAATGSGMNYLHSLMGAGPAQADLGPWQGGANSAMNMMLRMGQTGGNWNPEYQNMLFGGRGTAALNAAAANPSAVDPMLRMFAQGGVGMQALQNQAMTGGRQDINPQLEAIRTQGMQSIEDQLAQIREQYGSMGLGAGSDIADALGRGASRGIADIVRQQSELAYGADQAAQARMLQAGGMEQGAMAGLLNSVGQLGLGSAGQAIQAGGMLNENILGMGSLWNEAQNRSLASMQGIGNLANVGGQLALGNAGLASQYQGMQFGGANSMMNNPYAQNIGALTPGLSLYPQAAQANAESNLDRWYNEQLRYAQGPPSLQMATGYATNFPSPMQPYQRQSLWPSILGTAGGIASAAILASDRNLKEDIKPADGFLPKLKSLPLFTWKYKGDPLTHVGPMAQDFKATFGVGDGKHIFFGDMLSVIMGSLKELADAPA